MNRLILTAVALTSFSVWVFAADSSARSSFSVRDFGAAGGGQTNDTVAFQKALDACAAAGGGTVVVPKGVYVIGSVVIGAKTTLRLASGANLLGSPDIADYPLVRARFEGEFVQAHRALISAENADDISITGAGSIFGPPLTVSRLREPRGPVLIELTGCTNVVLEGFSTQYQQLWSIHLLYCQNVTARNLTIRTINTNGDGIDVDSSRDVLIERCSIDTGDDAISLKSGRGMEAVSLGRPTENITIKDCSLTSSLDAGLGVGTELSGGIRDVRLENCIISGHQNGIFLKSRDGRGGFIENLTGENLTINNSPTFLGINLTGKGILGTGPVTNAVEKWTLAKNITFKNIKVNDVAALVVAPKTDVPSQRPFDGLTLGDITGPCRKGITLANMTNVNISGINVTGFEGQLVVTTNVTGTGLDNPSAPVSTK